MMKGKSLELREGMQKLDTMSASSAQGGRVAGATSLGDEDDLSVCRWEEELGFCWK